MKAKIVKEGGGLWMFIDGEDKTAWPITEGEVGPIRNACNAWLEKKSQEILKETVEEG